MKIIFALLLVIFCFAGFAFSQTKPSKIVGVYQWCPFPCQTIKLNADFTFDYLLDGDLFNNERAKGIWKFVGKNKIYLKTFEKPLDIKVEEKGENEAKIINIQFLDQMGAVFNKTEFVINENKYVSDENGFCKIPKTKTLSILYRDRKTAYDIKNKTASELTVMIIDFDYPRLDDKYVIRKNQICLIDENDKVLDCFLKLKKATELRLFPSNSK